VHRGMSEALIQMHRLGSAGSDVPRFELLIYRSISHQSTYPFILGAQHC